MRTRSYHQRCGLAHALDLLGERWTLLVIRELSLGPKRFRDLLANLPGVGTNLLAARLKRLEAADVIRKATLPPPAGVQVYELTERGEALQPALESLALWGFPLLPDDTSTETVRASWAALSMRADMHAAHRDAPTGVFAFDIDGERFWVQTTDSHATVCNGVPPGAANVTTRTDLGTFIALADRRLTAVRAARSGTLRLEGDPAALDALLAAFHFPKEPTADRHATGAGGGDPS